MAEEGLLEPLVITEETDITESDTARATESRSVTIVQSCSREAAVTKEEEHRGENKNIATKMCLTDQRLENQQTDANDQTEEVFVTEEDKEKDDEPDETETTNDGQNRVNNEIEGLSHEEKRINETEDEEVTQNDPQVDIQSLDSPEGAKSQEEDQKKAHRLTPDFPEALYELLCTFQEGRRLNDQRCSFRMADGVRRRRCHSEPNTTRPANRVVFSSMTSLQKEEFFELVATAQARRLDDQRAQLERSPPMKSKGRSFTGSIRQLSFVKRPASAPAPAPAPAPVPKEDLYNMILTTQAQGRLEDQRSRAPGPMDDEDFFSLLLRVQGGRMEEQRTELPCLLQT